MAKRGRPPKKKPEDPNAARKKLDELQRWRFKVNRARAIREQWEKDYEVERCEEFFLGKQRPTGDDDSLVLNYFLATLKTTQPNLYFVNPKMYVRTRAGRAAPLEDIEARIAEGVLEAIAEQDKNLDMAMRLAVPQSFFRIGVLKIVYDPRIEPNPEAGKPIYQKDAAGNPMIDKARLRPMIGEDGEVMIDPQTGQPVVDPDSVAFLPMSGSDGAPMTEPQKVVTDEAYRYQWVNAKNMLLPDEGPDRGRWTWIGEEICVPLEEAKDDERFPARLRSKLRANETVDPRTGARQVMPGYYGEGPAARESERLRYFECYDIRNKRIYAYADGQDFDEFLLDDELPPGIEDHPYALLLGFTPIIAPKPLPWPLPYTHSWLDPQREYNIRRTQIMEGAKRSARKFTFTEGAFDDVDEAIKVLQSPKDMEGAKVTDPNGIKVLEAPDLNPSIYKDIPLLQIDWRTITGQTGARLGAPESNTATEASYVEHASNIRDVEMRANVESWLSEAGRKMLQRVKATLTLRMWVKLRSFSDQELQTWVQQVYGVAPQALKYMPGLKESFEERFGDVKWQEITRDDLTFEADVTVVPGSARPKNLEAERRAFVSLLQIFGQAPQLLLSRELTSRVLRMFEMEDQRLLDELTAVAQKMIEVNANQAGRNQGNGAEAASAGPLAGLAGMLTGAGVRPG